jgi:hypothetical protein
MFADLHGTDVLNSDTEFERPEKVCDRQSRTLILASKINVEFSKVISIVAADQSPFGRREEER